MALELILKARKSDAPTPSGEVVTLCEELQVAREMFDEAKALHDSAVAELVAEARALRAAELRSGIVANLQHGKVQVVWRESFRGISSENIPALRAAFDGLYARVVEEDVKVAFTKGTTLAAIESAIGAEAFDALSGLLTVTETVKPRKGATEACAELFRTANPNTAEDLLQFIEACTSAPQVRVK